MLLMTVLQTSKTSEAKTIADKAFQPFKLKHFPKTRDSILKQPQLLLSVAEHEISENIIEYVQEMLARR
jgi:hypothetical protein